MNEPKYDEDIVNLGYLKKVVGNETANSYTISRNFASRPKPPYYAGDTWTDGSKVYTCIKTRLVGIYSESDWTSESGAKEEAEKRNRTFLTQPINYNIGDMWILQSDTDHRSGKKGEILISTVKRNEYDSDDWINMIGYGNISSINEVAGNLGSAIGRIKNVEEAIEDGLITTYYQNSVPDEACKGDLWYVTDTIEEYIKEKLYRYNGTIWQLLNDSSIQEAFNKANEARLVADGKIQSFYSSEEPTRNLGAGDLWIDTDNDNKLYRYNGTNWVAVYDTRIDSISRDLGTITTKTTQIETDLGLVDIRVAQTETNIMQAQSDIEQAQSDVEQAQSDIEQVQSDIEEVQSDVEQAQSDVEQAQSDIGQVQSDIGAVTENLENNYYNKTFVNEQLSRLTLDSTQIQSQVTTKVNSEDYENMIQTLTNMITQNSGSVDFRFQNVQDVTDNLGNIIQEFQNVIEEYIRFSGALIELGRIGNDFTAQLSNEELAFLQNGIKIAYISNSRLYITDAEVLHSLKIGHWVWEQDSDGNLNLDWRG